MLSWGPVPPGAPGGLTAGDAEDAVNDPWFTPPGAEPFGHAGQTETATVVGIAVGERNVFPVGRAGAAKPNGTVASAEYPHPAWAVAVFRAADQDALQFIVELLPPD